MNIDFLNGAFVAIIVWCLLNLPSLINTIYIEWMDQHGETEGNREIDWGKVMTNGGYGVDVLVSLWSDPCGSVGSNLQGYSLEDTHKFYAGGTIWNYCRFPEGFNVPDKWYKEN